MRTGDKILTIDPVSPQPNLIAAAADTIKKGGVVLFPTRCLYGLGADAFNRESIEKIYRLKKRSSHKPILVLVKDRAAVDSIVRNISPLSEILMEKFWPGRVTFIFEANTSLPDILTAGTGKIGVRVPGHPVAAALTSALDNPLTGTSANISEQAGCFNAPELDPEIAGSLDLIIDAGPLKGGTGSTVVDVTSGKPVILREGAVAAKKIFRATEILDGWS